METTTTFQAPVVFPDTKGAAEVKSEPRAVATINDLDPQRINNLVRLAKIWCESGLLPAHVNTWQKALTIAMMADAINVPWLIGLNTMYVVHGKVGTEAKLMLAQIQRSGKMIDFDITGDKRQARCLMHRIGYSKPRIEVLTRQQADDAGWSFAYKDGKKMEKDAWRAMPDLMLQYRAISRCARFLFPDVILGLYTYDELDVPVRVVSNLEEPELDQETVAALAPAPPKTETEAEPRAGDLPTDEQKTELKAQMERKYVTGETILTPAERKKWTGEAIRNQTRQFYADLIQNIAAVADSRVQMREDKDAGGEEATLL